MSSLLDASRPLGINSPPAPTVLHQACLTASADYLVVRIALALYDGGGFAPSACAWRITGRVAALFAAGSA
jgi:hypothetical protein